MYADGEIYYSDDEIDEILTKADAIGVDDFPQGFVENMTIRQLKKFVTVIQ